jgi:hypothetical protein
MKTVTPQETQAFALPVPMLLGAALWRSLIAAQARMLSVQAQSLQGLVETGDAVDIMVAQVESAQASLAAAIEALREEDGAAPAESPADGPAETPVSRGSASRA